MRICPNSVSDAEHSCGHVDLLGCLKNTALQAPSVAQELCTAQGGSVEYLQCLQQEGLMTALQGY
jgi:hypothetical protein